MKIALIGFGKMGQEVARVIDASKKHSVVSVGFRNKTDKLDIAGIKKADVAIDFTSADIVLQNIEQVANLGKNLVIGTTGWYGSIDKVKQIVNKHKIGLIYGQNFSIGANVYFKITEYATTLFNKFGGYDVYGFEIHHREKKDSPSGTAKKLGDIIMKQFPKKRVLQNESLQRQIKEEELHFASVRGGVNPGYHQVIFDSAADEIQLTHAARSRRGFAEGAVMAAEFIKGKKGLYSFDELFKH